jgi:thymidylate synthase
MKIINVEATTLPDSWFQLVYNALEHGRDFKIDSGSFEGHSRKEFDFIVSHIKRPFERNTEGLPLIPEIPEGCEGIPAPTDKDYLVQYIPYIMGALTPEVLGEGVDWSPKKNESYTYGQRMTEEPVEDSLYYAFMEDVHHLIFKNHVGVPQLEGIVFDAEKIFNQVEQIIWEYKNTGHRNNQLVIQIAKPTDLLLLDPPCLRHIDTRIQDGKLHFFPYFRSWDLWSGYPANLAGISVLQEFMANKIGVEQGEMICTSKGLHLYDYSVDFAKMRCMF